MAPLSAIVSYLDGLLRTGEIPDYPGAVNGLQFANARDIRKVAAAVDFSGLVVREAARANAQLLLVHHGMFWGAPQPIVGPRYEALAALVHNDIAVYSSHLPLDLHPEWGNNVLLARNLGLQPTGGFARFKNVTIGVSGETDIQTAELLDRARLFSREHGGNVVATEFDVGRMTRRWGICTGAGADTDTIREAVERKIDTMIVGEGPHHTAVEAREHGIVIFYAGHYATETVGVRALGNIVAEQFGLESLFIDAPTGL
jgi:dinuclear metal center YbgI/SA1388 family protein